MYNSWNPKQPFINGCFNWMIPTLCIENGLFHQTSIYKWLFGFPGWIRPTRNVRLRHRVSQRRPRKFPGSTLAPLSPISSESSVVTTIGFDNSLVVEFQPLGKICHRQNGFIFPNSRGETKHINSNIPICKVVLRILLIWLSSASEMFFFCDWSPHPFLGQRLFSRCMSIFKNYCWLKLGACIWMEMS